MLFLVVMGKNDGILIFVGDRGDDGVEVVWVDGDFLDLAFADEDNTKAIQFG